MISESLSDRELTLLEEIEHDPDVTQASLAIQLGVAVGTVNLLIKRLISKGYVKVKRAQRRKLRYIITPEGLAFRANLAVHYIETSLHLYRKTRLHVRDLLSQCHQAGYNQVTIVGDGDLADICRLTCLEQGMRVLEASQAVADGKIPALEVQGTKVFLHIES
jgi:DNA-binding MarR family transcriptional regulator